MSFGPDVVLDDPAYIDPTARLYGKVVRTANMQVKNKLNAFLYWQNGLAYAKGQHRAWSDPAVIAAVAEEVKHLNAEFAAGG